MLRIGLRTQWPANRRAIISDGTVPLHKTMILGPGPAGELGPNAFLVEQGPGLSIRTHFHLNSQWQVFVSGTGLLGRKPVKPFVVQYVAPQTGYGPIIAGPDGLRYMTLRPSPQSGALYLPDARALLNLKAPKLQVTSASLLPDGNSSTPTVVDMITPQADGLAAWMIHIPATKSVAPPAHPGGLARYYLVVSGSMIASDQTLGPLSLAWVSDNDMAMPLEAGENGLDVIAMQFPGDAR